MLPMCARPIVLSASLAALTALAALPAGRRISTPASRSTSWSAHRPVAATTSTDVSWRVTSAGTSRAIRTSCRRICRAPAARGRRASSPRSRPRTAPSSPTSCRVAVIGPLLDPKTEKLFDPTEVQYLGNVNNGNRVCVAGAQSKIKTFDDARKIKAQFGGVSNK